MQCVAYLRVSTERQAEEGNGLDSQKRDIKAYCEKNDLLIADWYIDDGYTGANMERPALQRLISDCTAKKVKCVVAFKLDRLSRSMADGINIIEKVFMPNNVQFFCVHDSVSYDSPMEQAMTQMMAVFAQLDKNTMMLRMRGGMLERVKKGYWPGGGNTPYCYKYSKEMGILVPIPERKLLANKAMDMFIEGYSDLKIRHILGFRNEITVKQVLTSPVNIGKIPYKGEIYNGLHEPIFDEEKFYFAQDYRMQRRKKSSYRGKIVHLLTGLCFCGVCGCAMRYQKWTHGRHKIYCCSRDKYLNYLPNYDSSCNNTLEWADGIEDKVSDEIKKISLNIDSYAKESATMQEIYAEKLKSIDSKLSRLYDVYMEGNDLVLDKINGLEQEKKRVSECLDRETKQEISTKKRQKSLSEIKKVADIWDTISDQDKNFILKSIIEKIILVNGNIEIQIKEF